MQNDAPMFVNGSHDVCSQHFWGCGGGVPTGLLLGYGQDREGPLGLEGKLLLGHVQQVGGLRPGTADESLAGQQVRQPI